MHTCSQRAACLFGAVLTAARQTKDHAQNGGFALTLLGGSAAPVTGWRMIITVTQRRFRISATATTDPGHASQHDRERLDSSGQRAGSSPSDHTSWAALARQAEVSQSWFRALYERGHQVLGLN